MNQFIEYDSIHRDSSSSSSIARYSVTKQSERSIMFVFSISIFPYFHTVSWFRRNPNLP